LAAAIKSIMANSASFDAVEPNHLLGRVTGRRDSGLERVDGCPGVKHAANRAAAVLRAMLAGWVGPASVSLRRSRVVVTNNGRPQRIGGGDAGCPARADRCENLHRQGNQDDRKKFSAAAASANLPSPTLPINHAPSRVSRSRFPAMGVRHDHGLQK
jgi:hypothetical protein